MMRSFLKVISITVALLAAFTASAQSDDSGNFRKDAFTQGYNNPADTLGRDTTDTMFSIKEYIGALRHKNEIGVNRLFGGSLFFPGGMQIYNRDYWKLPIVYGALGTGIGMGIHYNHKYHRTGSDSDRKIRNLCWAGVGLTAWATLMEGTASYRSDAEPVGVHAGKATIYSLLLPGLGQAYNGEYWKIPLYYTGLIFTGSFIHLYNTNYHRYRRIYNEITEEGSTYQGKISASTALYYRNVNRRYRDYFIVGFAVMYILQVIDANVFAYMRDFEVNDDLSIKFGPTILPPDNMFAYGGSPIPNVGFRLGVIF